MVKKISLTLLSLILAQSILFAAQPAGVKSPELAGDFSLLDLEAKEVTLSSFKGKPVILFFWTTWCPYCRQELKQLDALKAEFVKTGTQVLAINVQEQRERVERFIQGRVFSYKILLDENGRVSRGYGIMGVPTYVYLDKESRIGSYGYNFSQEDYQGIISR
jgi:cytochrome c biogenesis protein CcmG/thiol:disulfide interchange protein DsbE